MVEDDDDVIEAPEADALRDSHGNGDTSECRSLLTERAIGLLDLATSDPDGIALSTSIGVVDNKSGASTCYLSRSICLYSMG